MLEDLISRETTAIAGLWVRERASACDLERRTFGGKFDDAGEAGLGSSTTRAGLLVGGRWVNTSVRTPAPAATFGSLPRCDVKRRALGQRSCLAQKEVGAVGKAMKGIAGSAVSRVGEGATLGADTQAVGLEAMLDRDCLDDDVAARDLSALSKFVGCEDGLLVLETPAYRRAHRGAPTGLAEDGQRSRTVSGAERQGMDSQREVGPVIG
jgi:hypothetical protein